MAAGCFAFRAAEVEKRGLCELLLDGAVVADVDVFTNSTRSRFGGRKVADAMAWLVGPADDDAVEPRVCGVFVATTPRPEPDFSELPPHVIAAAGLNLDARIDVLGLHLGGRCLLIHRAAGVFSSPAVRRLLQGGIEGVRVAGANMHLIGLSMHLDAAFGTPALVLHNAIDSLAPAAQRLPRSEGRRSKGTLPMTLDDAVLCAACFNAELRQGSLLPWVVPAGVDAWPWSSWRTLDDSERLVHCAAAAFAAACLVEGTLRRGGAVATPAVPAATGGSVVQHFVFTHRPLAGDPRALFPAASTAGTALGHGSAVGGAAVGAAAIATGAASAGAAATTFDATVLAAAARLLQQARKLKLAQRKETAVAVTNMEVDGSAAHTLKITPAAFEKRLRRDAPAYLQAACAGETVTLVGVVARVLGKHAFVEFALTPVATLEAVVACWARAASDVEVTTNNHHEEDAAISRACKTMSLTLSSVPAVVTVDDSTAVSAAAGAASAGEDGAPSALTLVPDATVPQPPAAHKQLGWPWAACMGLPLPAHPCGSTVATAADGALMAKLNESQQLALKNALSHPITCTQGPPGTGKTRTISSIAESRGAGKRVLVTAHSNSAVARAVEALQQQGIDDFAVFSSEEYFGWHEPRYASVLPHLVTATVHSTASERYSPCTPTSPATHHELLAGSKWVSPEFEVKAVPSVVVMTVTSAINMKSGMPRSWAAVRAALVKLRKIDVVIVDEASQVWEGLLHALAHRMSPHTRYVFVGDDKQLPPFGSEEAHCRSVFDALIANASVPRQTLSTCYRLPVDVVNVISPHLYGGMLASQRDACKDRQWCDKLGHAAERCSLTAVVKACVARYANGKPLTWVHYNGGEVITTTDTGSAANVKEAHVVARMASDLLLLLEAASRAHPDAADTAASAGTAAAAGGTDGGAVAVAAAGAGSKTVDTHENAPLVIITPYEHQRQQIERLLAKYIALRKGVDEVEVHEQLRGRRVVTCIDGYQGQEAEFVLVSLVKNDTIGFLRDDRRANVMLSRCRQGMIIVGNWYAPTSHKRFSSSLLAAMAQYCRATDALIGVRHDGVVTTPETVTCARGSQSMRWIPGRETLPGAVRDGGVPITAWIDRLPHTQMWQSIYPGGDRDSAIPRRTSERLPSSCSAVLADADFPTLAGATLTPRVGSAVGGAGTGAPAVTMAERVAAAAATAAARPKTFPLPATEPADLAAAFSAALLRQDTTSCKPTSAATAVSPKARNEATGAALRTIGAARAHRVAGAATAAAPAAPAAAAAAVAAAEGVDDDVFGLGPALAAWRCTVRRSIRKLRRGATGDTTVPLADLAADAAVREALATLASSSSSLEAALELIPDIELIQGKSGRAVRVML